MGAIVDCPFVTCLRDDSLLEALKPAPFCIIAALA